MRALGFVETLLGRAALGIAILFLASVSSDVAHGSPAASPSMAVPAPPSDALILAMRLATGPRPSRTLIAELEALLPRARMLHPMFDSVSALQDFDFHVLSVMADEKIAPRWQSGRLRVGDRLLDSLGTAFGLVEAKATYDPPASGEPGKFCHLRFAQALNMKAVAAVYQRSPAVLAAAPNTFSGDGDNIWAMKTESGWEFVFSRGWGDCMAGCINRRSFFVAVDSSGRALVSPIWPPPEGPDGPVERPWLPLRWRRSP